MTESEWLTSTDPAAMLRHVEQTATELQLRAFVEACRERWARTPEQQDRASNWRDLTWRWVAFDAGSSKIIVAARCNILRDIFGDPWRQSALCGAGLNDGTNCHRCQAILRWNDGTIPKLARAIRGGERCEECHDGSVWQAVRRQGMEWDEAVDCSSCHGTGKTPSRFQDMPIIADALMEAGVPEDSELVKHCQGWARCSTCLGRGWCVSEAVLDRYARTHAGQVRFAHGTAHQKACECSSGWLRSDAGHVRGCWVLQLILGGE